MFEKPMGYILESTVSVILLTLVIMNADSFIKVVGAAADALVGSVHALWGPQGA